MLQKGEEEDEKREEAIASNPSLQPNFKPKRVTQDQLSKLQVCMIVISPFVIDTCM
jgi:hypothetical protein